MKALLHSCLLFLSSSLIAQNAVNLSALQQYIDESVARDLNQGILIGIHTPEGETFLMAGTFSPDDPRPITPDTLFEVGGVTTLFTSATTATLVQRHQLTWTTPLSSFLPAGYPVPSFEGNPIRLHDLATHSSGLPRYPSHWEPSDWRSPFADYDEAAQRKALASTTLHWKPGSRYDFSEWGYSLLAQAIAIRAGEPFSEVLRKNITEPLGLNDTTFTPNEEQSKRLAPGHMGLTAMPPATPGTMLGGLGLYSSGRDLLKFVAAEQNHPNVPLLTAFRDTQQIQIETGMEGTMVTRGWHVTLREGESIFWQTGLSSGYACFVGFNPSNRRAVVILTNSAQPLDAVGFHILAPNIFPLSTLPKLTVLPESELERFTGTYALGPNIDVIVTRNGQNLYAEIGDQAKVRLYPIDSTRFIYGNSERILAFELSPDQPASGLILQEGLRNYRALRKKE